MKKLAIGLLFGAAALPMAAGLVSLPGASQKSWDGTGLWGISRDGAIPADMMR